MEDALLPPEQEVARSNRAGRTNPLNSVQGLSVWPWLPQQVLQFPRVRT